MKKNKSKIEDVLQEYNDRYGEKKKYIVWEREMSFLLIIKDNLTQKMPDLYGGVDVNEHLNWQINMTYVHELIKEHASIRCRWV